MTKLYIISPPQIELDSFAHKLELALEKFQPALFQLRLKDVAESEILRAAEKLIPICHKYGVKFIMNDSAMFAEKSGADGVHLGENDGDIAKARKLIGDKIIGVSCYNSLERALEMADAGADIISFGAFFPTTTKVAKAKADVSLIREWRKLLENGEWRVENRKKTNLQSPISNIPKCAAIGGINFENKKPLEEAGADYICMISAIWSFQEKD